MTDRDKYAPQAVLTTSRLALRRLTEDDANFVVAMLNDADFLKYIGDRGVRTADDAVTYLRNGTLQSYRDNGFGMYCVQRLSDGAEIGFCGLVRREWLEDIDLGFAFLPAFRGAGYAAEAAIATLDHAFADLGLARVLAITKPDNHASIALLDKLGMSVIGNVCAPGEKESLCVYELRRAAHREGRSSPERHWV